MKSCLVLFVLDRTVSRDAVCNAERPRCLIFPLSRDVANISNDFSTSTQRQRQPGDTKLQIFFVHPLKSFTQNSRGPTEERFRTSLNQHVLVNEYGPQQRFVLK